MTTRKKDLDKRDRERPFAVVDIGSNSVRLVVFERLSRAPLIMFNEKSLSGLGKDLDKGRLAPDSVESALRALARFHRIADALGAGEIDAVATEAVRRAADGAKFLKAAERALGAPVEVLEGLEEARISALGVAQGLAATDGVSGDLGGGSIDFSFLGSSGPQAPFGSVPLGTLPVGAALAKGKGAAEALVAEHLGGLRWLGGAARGRRFYVVGGGWRAIARVRMAQKKAPLKVVHGYTLAAADALKASRNIVGMSAGDLGSLPGIPRRRAPTIQAAAFVFERVIRVLEPDSVVFSASGLREGRLFDRLDEATRAEDPLLAGAADFGRAHSRIRSIGRAMAEWTGGLFPDETPPQRRLRLAACEMADAGWRDHPDSRARDAFFRIAHYPLLGIDHAQRSFLALTALLRYGGDGADPVVEPIVGLMSVEEQRRALALGAALSLGFRLSGGVPDLLAPNPLRLVEGGLSLELADRASAPDDDSLQTRLKALARHLGASEAKLVA